LRARTTTLAAQVDYVDQLGLNGVHIDGKLVGDELFDLFDARGLVVINTGT
jgi:hypothetical protein